MIRPATCPICHRAITTLESAEFAPFCTERCRQVDFFRWFDGKYAIVESADPDLLDSQFLDQEQDGDGYPSEDV